MLTSWVIKSSYSDNQQLLYLLIVSRDKQACSSQQPNVPITALLKPPWCFIPCRGAFTIPTVSRNISRTGLPGSYARRHQTFAPQTSAPPLPENHRRGYLPAPWLRLRFDIIRMLWRTKLVLGLSEVRVRYRGRCRRWWFFSGGGAVSPSGVKCHTFIRAALLLDMFTACLSSSSREYNAARLAVWSSTTTKKTKTNAKLTDVAIVVNVAVFVM